MKTLFVYYSLEGNCRDLSRIMAVEVGGTVEGLQLAGGDLPAGFFKRYYRGGRGSLLKETPELMGLTETVADYDLVVVGSPVWFWNMTPAVRSFLTAADFTGKKAAVFAMYRGGAGVTISAMSKLIEQRGGTVVARAGFRDLRGRDADSTVEKALEWVRGLEARAR